VVMPFSAIGVRVVVFCMRFSCVLVDV